MTSLSEILEKEIKKIAQKSGVPYTDTLNIIYNHFNNKSRKHGEGVDGINIQR